MRDDMGGSEQILPKFAWRHLWMTAKKKIFVTSKCYNYQCIPETCMSMIPILKLNIIVSVARCKMTVGYFWLKIYIIVF